MPARHVLSTTPASLSAAAAVFAMLAEPTRLHLLVRLREGPADVTTLTAATGATRTSVSQHLAKLRLAGLVVTERRGRHVHYALVGGHVARLVAEGLSQAEHEVAGLPQHD